MKTIYFVRHGESESNVRGIMSGSGNDIHLTPTGRTQAKRAGQDLKSKGVELIISSPMIRALDTATIIAEEIGYNPKDIITNPLLVERAYGIYEGEPGEKYKEAYKNGSVHESVETEKQLYDRLQKVVEELRQLKEDCIMLVAHGGVRRALYVINEGLHHSHMYKIDSFGNAEIYEFTL